MKGHRLILLFPIERVPQMLYKKLRTTQHTGGNQPMAYHRWYQYDILDELFQAPLQQDHELKSFGRSDELGRNYYLSFALLFQARSASQEDSFDGGTSPFEASL